MGLVYLALRRSGKWTTCRKGQAKMPPFEAVDGPYDVEVAHFIIIERNKTWGRKRPVPTHERARWLI